MRIILDTTTNKTYRYPRADDQPIVGLEPHLSVLEVIEEPQPEITEGFYAQRAEPVDDLQAGTRTIGWEVVESPKVVEPDYTGFYSALLTSNVYQRSIVPALRAGLSVPLTSFTTVFRFAIEDALNGRIQPNQPTNPNSFQSALWLLMESAQGIISTDDIMELQVLMNTYHLDIAYVLIPPELS